MSTVGEHFIKEDSFARQDIFAKVPDLKLTLKGSISDH